MGAVEVELQRVTVTLKNETHVECVAALHEVTDYAQPNPRVPVRTWRVPGRWFDIGSKETLEEANRIFAKR